MDDLTVQQRVNRLRASGYNAIHIFGNVYLVRHKSIYASKIPLYLITIFKENT